MNKEEWISDILQSAKEIKPVAANPYMATRIEAKLQNAKGTTTSIPVRWVYATLAVMIVIVTANIFIWSHSSQLSEQKELRQIIQDYGWSSNDPYSIQFSN
jgi:hypothetical protein